jgi:hypothetical protein
MKSIVDGIKKIETNSNKYGKYTKYHLGNLRIKYFEENRYITISGSIRQYYFTKEGKGDEYWKYNLTINNLKEIGCDFKELGIDLDRLLIVSYEYGPTLNMSNVIQYIEIFNNGILNTYGTSAIKGISKYVIKKDECISGASLFRIYSPEIMSKVKKVGEHLEYLRIEDYLSKDSKKRLGLTDRTVYSMLLNENIHFKMKRLLIKKLERILFIKNLESKDTTFKKNILFTRSMSVKKNRIIADEIAKKYDNNSIKMALYRIRKENKDITIFNKIKAEIEDVFNNSIRTTHV